MKQQCRPASSCSAHDLAQAPRHPFTHAYELQTLPTPTCAQALAGGRKDASLRLVKGSLARIKACLGWLPLSWDYRVSTNPWGLVCEGWLVRCGPVSKR